MRNRGKLLGTVLGVLLAVLAFANQGRAMYLNDGSLETAPGVYANPGDGFCVSGIKTDGTMAVVPGITNFRDCTAYTTGLTGMTAADVTALSTCSTAGVAPYDKPCNVAANCARAEGNLVWVAALQKCFDNSACTLQGAAGNDGAKHTYSTSICINPATRAGISRLDLDNTAAMCIEKGGVLADGLYGHPYGACTAYGWVYGGVKADLTLPNVSANTGVLAGEGLGFCYTTMNLTSVSPAYTVVTCPSQNNLSLVCTGGTNVGKTCAPTTQAADCPGVGGGTCAPNAGWSWGTDNAFFCASGANIGKTCTVASQVADCGAGVACGTNAPYQSQASYDAGLGWAFSSPKCTYAYGVKGYINADLRGPDGAIATAPLCGGGTGLATGGKCTGGANVGLDCATATAVTDCPTGGTAAACGSDGLYCNNTSGANEGKSCTVANSAANCGAALRCTVSIVNAGKCLDFTGILNQGACIAAGGTWDNWLPTLTGVPPGATTQAVATLPTGSTIMKLDATTLIASGGGKFYSGTGSICLKCHSDESRSYMERNKPGFIDSGHKLAGDTPPWTTVGSTWGLKGVQCEICHATGKPTRQDVGLVVYPNRTGTNAGLPRGASGHNQTEYGSHVTGVCYFCHGTPTAPVTGNPAAVIPVAAGDFALTSKNLAPIANQFLNSPHARYTGNSKTVEVISKANYASTFVGKICRTGSEVTDAATTGNNVDVTAKSTCGGTGLLTCNSATNCPATPGGARLWNPVTSKCYDAVVCAGAAGKSWDATTLRCVETQTTCEAQSDSGYSFIWSATGVAGNPSIITASGAGCFKPFGNGSIVTTFWDGLAAEKVPNLDSSTNTACTSATGAASFWTTEGETASTVNGVAVAATDQGNCMTCHDVHWSLDSTDPEAEPIRRECTTCHVNPGTSASAATQIDLATIKHPGGIGTPLEHQAAAPYESCEICHMPRSSATGARMHLWRVNTSSTFTTMGATQANTAAEGTYANAAWVDLDRACGQCHGGSAGASATKNGAMYFDKPYLSFLATGMHSQLSQLAPTAAYTSLVTNTGLAVSFTDNSSDNNGQAQNTLAVSVNWNDGKVSSGVGGGVFTHSYASPGTYNIVHTVRDTGSRVASELIPIKIAAVTPVKYTLMVKVRQWGGAEGVPGAAIPGATVYLKKLTSGGWYSQINYNYTNASGNFTFNNLVAGQIYQVVVYSSATDFNGAVAGKTAQVSMSPILMDKARMVQFIQGQPATNGPVGKLWAGTNGSAPTIGDVTP